MCAKGGGGRNRRCSQDIRFHGPNSFKSFEKVSKLRQHLTGEMMDGRRVGRSESVVKNRR